MPRRLFAAVVLAGVLAISAHTEHPTFHAQYADNDYYALQWSSEHVSPPPVGYPGGVPTESGYSHPPHFPGNHPSKEANATILSILKENSEFSRLFKVVNISDEIISLLNDTSTNLTFFALPNHAIPKRPRHLRARDFVMDPLLDDFSLVDLVSHVESIDIDDTEHPDAARPSKEQVKKIVTAILSYHIIPDNLDLESLLKNTTHPTNLSHVFGALNDEPLRLRVGTGLPFARVNYYSTIVRSNIKAMNGFIHVINHPLLPPPSVFQSTFLLQSEFATFSSAVQRTGLTDAVDYTLVPDSEGKTRSVKGSAVVTAFVPSNKAFAKLPKKLQIFLFSPFGEGALKKLLQYHIVPDIALYTDWVLNATSDAITQRIDSMDFLSVDEWPEFEGDSYGELLQDDHYSGPQPESPCSPPHPPHQHFSPASKAHQGHSHPLSCASHAHGLPQYDANAYCARPPLSPHCVDHQSSQPLPNAHEERACTPPPFECSTTHTSSFDPPDECACFSPPPQNKEGATQYHGPPPPWAGSRTRHTHFECAPPSSYRHHYPHLPPPSSAYGAFSPPPHHLGNHPYSSPSYAFHPHHQGFGWQYVPPQYSYYQYGPPPPSYHGGYGLPPSPLHFSPHCTCAHPPAPPAHRSFRRDRFPGPAGECPPPGKGESHGHKHPFPHPPHSPLPKPTVVGNFTLPTALEGHSLNVVIVRIPIKLPIPKHGKELGHITKVIVNGRPIKGYDGVALNGALYTVDTLISPRHGKGKPDHKPAPHIEGDEWEDWEDWLPGWAEI